MDDNNIVSLDDRREEKRDKEVPPFLPEVEITKCFILLDSALATIIRVAELLQRLSKELHEREKE